MSQTRKNISKCTQEEHHTLVRRCMAIVLQSTTIDPDRNKCRSRKDSSSTTLEPGVAEGPGPPDDCPGPSLFHSLVRENVDCFWNPTLVQCIRDLEYKGCLSPSTILVSGSEYDLEVVRSAWARRMLRAPEGYDIALLGDMDAVKMNLVAQTQFAPLPEALCKVVYDLNTEGVVANMSIIGKKLKSTFPEINLPEENILYKALGTLIRERKLYHTGRGYSVVTPDTFRLLAMSPPLERQMLLTNEEAIVRLHGACSTVGRQACTQTNQRLSSTLPLTAWSSCERILCPSGYAATGQSSLQSQQGKLKRCHSLKLLRGKEKDKLCRSNSFRAATASPVPARESKSDVENMDPNKKEKSSSMFSKLFRRGRGDKCKSLPNKASFSSQFPPRDRSDPDFVHYNSRGTQTPEGDEVPPTRAKARSSSLNRVPSNRDRHSQALSTPATPKASRRSNNVGHSADVYHFRSSSLSRRPSPSPKRDSVRGTPQLSATINHRKTSPKSLNRNRQPAATRPLNETPSKPRPKYESPFYPVRSNGAAWPLRAGEKYGDRDLPALNGNSTFNTTAKLPTATNNSNTSNSSFHLPRTFISTSSPPWRNAAGVSELMKPSPIVGVPSRSVMNREMASVPPSTSSTLPIAKPQAIKSNVPNPSPMKNVQLGGTVDVEISVGSHKKGLLTTDLDADTKKNSVKIEATWNHSISSKTSDSKVVDSTSIKQNPTVTASASITTSVTKGPKSTETVKTVAGPSQMSSQVPVKVIKSTTIVDCTGQCTIVSETPNEKDLPNSSVTSSRSKLADAKRDFFSDSPCPTETQCSKDDSGFSSSTSTSRPMSVSPC